MNQLALAIRSLDREGLDRNVLQLSSGEIEALNAISAILKMTDRKLAKYLEGQVEPTDWLIPIPIPGLPSVD